MSDELTLEEKFEKLPHRTPDRELELLTVERKAIINFTGTIDDLASAIGLLRNGDYWGWRVLYIIHNKRTIRKYENILDIKVKEFFPEEGSQSHRSVGYTLAKKIGNFWKAVSGDIKIEDRRIISE